MKIYCDTAVLCEACLNVQRAVSNKTTIPAIEGILIKAIGNELLLKIIHSRYTFLRC